MRCAPEKFSTHEYQGKPEPAVYRGDMIDIVLEKSKESEKDACDEGGNSAGSDESREEKGEEPGKGIAHDNPEVETVKGRGKHMLQQIEGIEDTEINGAQKGRAGEEIGVPEGKCPGGKHLADENVHGKKKRDTIFLCENIPEKGIMEIGTGTGEEQEEDSRVPQAPLQRDHHAGEDVYGGFMKHTILSAGAGEVRNVPK
jgi:hypothetical protein